MIRRPRSGPDFNCSKISPRRYISSSSKRTTSTTDLAIHVYRAQRPTTEREEVA